MGTDMGEFAIKIRVTLMDEITEDKGKYQHPTSVYMENAVTLKLFISSGAYLNN